MVEINARDSGSHPQWQGAGLRRDQKDGVGESHCPGRTVSGSKNNTQAPPELCGTKINNQQFLKLLMLPSSTLRGNLHMHSCNGYKRSPLPETTDHPSLITFLQINHLRDLPGHSHSFHPHAWWRKQLRQQHSVPSNCWPIQARREWWARKHLHISSGSQKALVMGEHPAFPQVLVLCVVLGYKRGINLVERNSNKESCPTVLRHFVRF